MTLLGIRVGTSGYSYDEWSGPFYPQSLPAAERLAFYGQRIDTVEINNTYYRVPRREVVERWAAAVPDGFRFAVKASRRITHEGRLKEPAQPLAYLARQLAPLGDRLGVVLFQCPPYLPCNVERLRGFLAAMPPAIRPVFEFRHASWDAPEVRAVLGDAGAALCVAENAQPEGDEPLVSTTDWGYLRLRAPDYDDDALRRWALKVHRTWADAYVFFKHESSAPRLVQRFLTIARSLPGAEV